MDTKKGIVALGIRNLPACRNRTDAATNFNDSYQIKSLEIVINKIKILDQMHPVIVFSFFFPFHDEIFDILFFDLMNIFKNNVIFFKKCIPSLSEPLVRLT